MEFDPFSVLFKLLEVMLPKLSDFSHGQPSIYGHEYTSRKD